MLWVIITLANAQNPFADLGKRVSPNELKDDPIPGPVDAIDIEEATEMKPINQMTSVIRQYETPQLAGYAAPKTMSNDAQPVTTEADTLPLDISFVEETASLDRERRAGRGGGGGAVQTMEERRVQAEVDKAVSRVGLKLEKRLENRLAKRLRSLVERDVLDKIERDLANELALRDKVEEQKMLHQLESRVVRLAPVRKLALSEQRQADRMHDIQSQMIRLKHHVSKIPVEARILGELEAKVRLLDTQLAALEREHQGSSLVGTGQPAIKPTEPAAEEAAGSTSALLHDLAAETDDEGEQQPDVSVENVDDLSEVLSGSEGQNNNEEDVDQDAEEEDEQQEEEEPKKATKNSKSKEQEGEHDLSGKFQVADHEINEADGESYEAGSINESAAEEENEKHTQQKEGAAARFRERVVKKLREARRKRHTYDTEGMTRLNSLLRDLDQLSKQHRQRQQKRQHRRMRQHRQRHRMRRRH